MNQIIKKEIILTIVLIVLLIPTSSIARYYEKIQNIRVKAIIAEPIFKVENEKNTIEKTINKESNIESYVFSIRNYELEENSSEKRISQVSLEYVIEIINEKEDFPIEYKLYELDTEKEILNGSNKTEAFKVESNLEYEKKYRLEVFWKENNEILSENTSIRILINASQSK